MTAKAKIVVMSHLSDVQAELFMEHTKVGSNLRINFVKYIILECGGDLNQEINPDMMWEKFTKEFKR